ncbi:MAG: FAD-binding oxidoreductase [Acidimicrobiales bacterium]
MSGRGLGRGSGPPPALAAFAAEVGGEGPVAAEGSRTRWDDGGALAAGTRLVRAPSGVLEHKPEEMTVRVLAGTLVDELHAELGARGQRTALPRRGGTVGGALAVGENDVSVLGRGRVRDTLLQVRYVAADGAVVQGGGPTVKNVSGFDLPRLIVGSLGTLAILGEVILRTNPVPAHSRWVTSTSADPFAVRDLVRRASCVLWDGTRTLVELEGHGLDVEADLRVLGREAEWTDAGGPLPLPPHRWSLSPAALRAIDREALGDWVASIGVGTVHASRPQPPAAVPAPLAALAQRVKEGFDPSGRLAPGRTAWRRAA